MYFCAQIQLLAIGAYQLQAVQRAAQCLQKQGVSVSVIAIIEPARLRIARDAQEASYVLNDEGLAACIPYVQKRLFVCHTRPEIMTGVLRRLDTGYGQSCFVGYKNRGGTLDVFGMLYANGITLAHLVKHSAVLLGLDLTLLLSDSEIQAVNGLIQPDCLR